MTASVAVHFLLVRVTMTASWICSSYESLRLSNSLVWWDLKLVALSVQSYTGENGEYT
ncbi:hypothetical protein DPMN_138120 [Dreissena polymorpha]|uniref:Uncharacterized protein n=1 Tax=Dreissena polymorpha TaxID=45954 RepID=A0A9D4G6Q4_DREPO|nr:hypothetical protein DPMN_138120 [Dreissena polymorpha]